MRHQGLPDMSVQTQMLAATALAALIGLLLGLYGWRVAQAYDRLLGPDDHPDARLLFAALCAALPWRALPLAGHAAGHTASPLGNDKGAAPADAAFRAAADSVAALPRLPGRTHVLWRYVPAAAMAVACALAQARYGVGPTALGLAWAAALLVLGAQIDARTGFLPDALTLPLLWTGLALSWSGHGLVPLADALGSVMAAYAGLWLLAWLFRLVRGRDGLGGGDIKLVAAAGAWLGGIDVFLMVFVASVSGLLSALLAARGGRVAELPFGPHLAGAALLLMGLRMAGVSLYPA